MCETREGSCLGKYSSMNLFFSWIQRIDHVEKGRRGGTSVWQKGRGLLGKGRLL